MIEIWNFARFITFISCFQKYLNTMLCQPFLIKVLQSFIKVGPFSNYYIKAINKGKNDINPSLESREIGLYIYNNALYRPINFFC